MVINMEMWPRTAVVDWAKRVFGSPVDTAADTLTSKIIAPYDNATTWAKYDQKITGFTTVN